MTQPIYFAPLRTPFVDLQTGLISREWYLFLQAMFNRVGGASGPSTDDLAMAIAMNDATGDDPTAAQASGAIRGDTPLTWLDM